MGDIVRLEGRYRARARVENRIRCAKDTGLENLPFHDFRANRLGWSSSWPPKT